MATIIISMLKEYIYTNVKLVLPLANPPIMMFVGRGGRRGGLELGIILYTSLFFQCYI